MTDKKYFVDLYSEMIEINSVNPSGGGRGEEKRAEFLKKKILGWSKEIKFEEYLLPASSSETNITPMLFCNSLGFSKKYLRAKREENG